MSDGQQIRAETVFGGKKEWESDGGRRRRMIRLPTREHVFAMSCSQIGRFAESFGVRLDRPVFIIGTGRCGTTLLVRILNSHPDIAGYPGEANELWHPKLEPFESAAIDIPPIEVDPRRFSEVSLANWPAGQDRRVRNAFLGYSFLHRRRRVFFTKSAMISFMIPRILELFPDARFIHIFRFGPDVVESYFKKNFGKYSKYRFREDEYRLICASYWNQCILEIERQKRALRLSERGALFEIAYETLCDRPEEILHAISAYLRIPAEGFKFDVAEITNRNASLERWRGNRAYFEAADVMASGLELMGYSSERLAIALDSQVGGA
jgi:hypothetical protein